MFCFKPLVCNDFFSAAIEKLDKQPSLAIQAHLSQAPDGYLVLEMLGLFPTQLLPIHLGIFLLAIHQNPKHPSPQFTTKENLMDYSTSLNLQLC